MPAKKKKQLLPMPLYSDMRSAIAKCHAVDELKDYADKSTAMASYYAQIKDDASVRKFNEIRLRAYRRIGQILIAGLDADQRNLNKFSSFQTQKSKIQFIRDRFPNDPTIAALSDQRIIQLIRLAGVPDKDFDRALPDVGGSLQKMSDENPEFKAQITRQRHENEQRRKEAEIKYAEQRARDDTERREISFTSTKEIQVWEDLIEANKKAMGEVGYTMDRFDREEMHRIVFLIKKDIHEILRKAAFDHRITMQEVLRRGLMMWFAAHGYELKREMEDA